MNKCDVDESQKFRIQTAIDAEEWDLVSKIAAEIAKVKNEHERSSSHDFTKGEKMMHGWMKKHADKRFDSFFVYENAKGDEVVVTLVTLEEKPESDYVSNSHYYIGPVTKFVKKLEII